MSEHLAEARETFNEIRTQAREVAKRRFSPGAGRCPYCDTKQGDEDGGLHLLFDRGDVQPGDVLWDGEFWLACRHCNWDFERGKPYRIPEGAIIMEGEKWYPTAHWSVITSAVSAVPTS